MRLVFELVVQDVNVSTELQKQKQLIKDLNKELQGVEEGTADYHDLVNQIAAARVQVTSLTAAQKELNRQFKEAQLPKDSLAALRIEYSRLAEQISRLSKAERESAIGQSLVGRAKSLKDEINGIEQSIGRFTGSVGNYKIATDGLTTGFRNLFGVLSLGFGADVIVQEISKVSDAIAEVQKTAQLTEEQARALSEELRFRDTRTSLADQLQIAAIGGQLGIATEQLKDFTAATDVLNVALGDQFGNVENITREFAGLRNVLTDFKTENVSDDILKLGNAVNFLEAQGAATAPVIVDFASRIAGAAVPLGATTEQILGLSTALAELNISPERGATAVQRLLVELAKAPEVFAKAIGEPAEQFTKFVQEDIIGALGLVSQRVAQSSKANTDFAKTLDDLGIGAQGAVEVFGKLGGSVDLVNKRIGQTADAITNANSVTAEFESKNNNAAAAVEKLKNSIVNLFTSNFAQDAVEAFANALSVVTDALSDLPGFVDEYKASLLALSAALIIVRREQIGVTISSIAQSRAWLILTNSTARATAATQLLGLAQKALPVVAVAVAVYALVKAFDSLTDSQDNATAAAESFSDAQKKVNEEAAKEIASVTQRINILKSEVSSKEQKKAAIDSLIEQYPDYLKGLDLEKASVQELTKIQDVLNKQIVFSIAQRQKLASVEELLSKSVLATVRAQQIQQQGFEALTPEEVQRAGLSLFGTEFEKRFVSAEGKVIAVRTALKQLGEDSQNFKKQADFVAESFDKAFGTKPDIERNLSAAEQDALDARRQFAERAKGVADTATQTVNTIEQLEQRIKALRVELNKTPIGSERFKELQKTIQELERQLNAARQTAKQADSDVRKSNADREKELDAQIKRITELRQAIRELDSETITNEFDRREIDLQNRRVTALEQVAIKRTEIEEKIRKQKGVSTELDKDELRLIDEQTASIKAAFDKRGDEISEQRQKAVDNQRSELQRLSLEVTEIAAKNAEALAQIQVEIVSEGLDSEIADLKSGLEERQKALQEQLISGDITRKQFDRLQIEAQEQFNVRSLEIEQRRFERIKQISEQLRDAKIQAAQATLAAEIDAINKAAAADIAGIRKRGAEQGISPQSIEEQVAQREAKALKERERANIEFIKSVQDANEAVKNSQIAGLNEINQKDKEVHDDKLRRIAEEEQRRKDLSEAIFDSAQSIANTLTTVETNNAQRIRDERIAALDSEFATRREKAQHNSAQLEKLDKEYQKRRVEIEKQAARERKKIALKEAVIQGALNIIKLLSNPFAAAAAAVAAAAQIAIIASQEFAKGGRVKRLQPGIIKEKQNAPRTAGGDTVLVYAKPGEMFLNEEQQRKAVKIAGRDFFHRIGVPGVSKNFLPGIVQSFTGGGAVLDFTPQIALPNESKVIVIQTEATFSDEQVEIFAARVANKTAAETSNATRESVAEGLNDANRRTERELNMNTQREV